MDRPVGAAERALVETIEAIAAGVHLPGARVMEPDIVQASGVSRSTARTVLLHLRSLGLVEPVDPAGWVVAGLTASDARVLHQVRVALEPLLVGRFLDRADACLLRELEALTLLEIELVEDGPLRPEDRSMRRVRAVTDRFYDVLIAGADSWVLASAVRAERARLQVHRRSVLPPEQEAERMRAVVGPLRSFVPLIRRRDEVAATRLCERHLREDAARTLGSAPVVPQQVSGAGMTAAARSNSSVRRPLER
jgi:DNA-binding GntR family transcriptional regulator